MKMDTNKEDKFLAKLFDLDRWESAIEKGYGKGINKGELKKMCEPIYRYRLCEKIVSGEYLISPPHTAQIPKRHEPGKFRTVYVNKGIDRLLLAMANDILFEECGSMVHPSCKSYQKGESCGKVVIPMSNAIAEAPGIIGWKSDFSKYFDSVAIEHIMKAFDKAEKIMGKSVVFDMLRKYYLQDLYIDGETGEVMSKFQSLKQGCAVASWLADVVMYDLDKRLSKMKGIYARYSDDCVFIGADYKKAMDAMVEECSKKGITLNPKKVEYIDRDHWFYFLGFSIRGKERSLSQEEIELLNKEVKHALLVVPPKGKDGKRKFLTEKQAVAKLKKIFYQGYEGYSWATRVLRVINCKHDIEELNKFFMDAIRGAVLGRFKIAGIGFRKEQKDGCIYRPRSGQNVTSNRERMPELKEYKYTIKCMQDNLMTSRGMYDVLVNLM